MNKGEPLEQKLEKPSAKQLLWDLLGDIADEMPDVIDFWGNRIDEMSYENALFFDDEKSRTIFTESIERFKRRLEVDIDKVEVKIKFFPNRMSLGWKSKLRKASYHAFFLHFGARRRGEVDDETGEKLEFVYHVMKATFDCLFGVDYYFDEKAMIAEILHDSREDFYKGILSIMKMSKSNGNTLEDLHKAIMGSAKKDTSLKSMAPELIRYLSEFEEDFFPTYDESKDVSDLIEVVTKSSSDRFTVVSEFIHKLMKGLKPVDLDNDLIEEYTMGEFIDAIKYKIYDLGLIDESTVANGFVNLWMGLEVKASDRRQNMETFRSGVRSKSPMVPEQIEFETLNLFLVSDEVTGNYLSADSFKDFLYLQDSIKREEFVKINEDVEEKTRIKEKFLADFADRLCCKLGHKCRLGVDYWIELKDVGLRWLMDISSLDLAKDRPMDYAKRFRNFVFFISSGEDSLIADAAVEVFMEIFSFGLNKDQCEIPELNSALGKRVLECGPGKVGGVGIDKNDDGFGMGVWSVFASKEDFGRYMLGDLYMARFFDDKEAIKRVRRYFSILKYIWETRKRVEGVL